jgi:putative ABC transport system permease protein
LYVGDQYSYDKYHRDAEDIYRVNRINTGQHGRFNVGITATPLGPALKKQFPEILLYARVSPFIGVDKHLVSWQDKRLWEKDAFIVDSTFFDLFTYRSVRGDLHKALTDPYTVVLSRSFADKLFGNFDPIGHTITIDNTWGKHDYTVMGVAESPGKSHIQANIFITMNIARMGQFMPANNSFTMNSYWSTYVKLRHATDPAAFDRKLQAFIDKEVNTVSMKTFGSREEDYLQPVANIHTTAGLDNPGIGKPVNPSFLAILLLIATLIQVIACINFMNLSTARASKRAMEVGVRKVIGAGRKGLIWQFLAESILLALVSVLIALPLLIAFLPWLNRITGSTVDISFLANIRIWLLLPILVLVTGLMAGSYPAFYLSAFKPIRVIKGNFTSHLSSSGIRKGLVVFQFVLSITLMIGIIVIYAQMDFIRNRDLGFDKDQRLVFTFNSEGSFDGLPQFMDDARRLADVKEVSNASQYLGFNVFYSNSFLLPGQSSDQQTNASYIVADKDFVAANGIRILAGRDFREGDSASTYIRVLINETYAKHLGLTPGSAPGTRLHDLNDRNFEVAGVMKDFNFYSLHQPVDNFMIWMTNPRYGYWPHVVVHANTDNYRNLLSRLESIWHKHVPGIPFEYLFLDEAVQRQYEADITMSRVINSFTMAAILISCLGLFGLAAFSAEQRSKEIGIRKVLGASVPGIVRLLSGNFLRLVLIALLIASPIAWWALNKWLQNFAYQIRMQWWMFALAGAIATAVAVCTISFQAIRAGLVNPVRSLRNE